MHRWTTLAFAVAIVSLVSAADAQAAHFSTWAPAQKVDEIAANSSELNTPSLDGCPIQSPDGLSLYMASNRPGGMGSLDIWVAHRASTDAPFGAPENLGEPINSAADDFCPTPIRGGGLFFVSRRTTAESCGLGDIYFSRLNPVHGWATPSHLACAPEGPNSDLDEQGPSYVEVDGRTLLYFSRSSVSVPGDIYVGEKVAGGSFGPASPVAELNSAANDIQPNVRKDGLEVVFSSNHAYAGAQGGQDVYVSTRASADDPWSAPVNLGTAVNTPAGETRPSLSWDARTLLFGRAPGPEGMSDIYVATRDSSPERKGDLRVCVVGRDFGTASTEIEPVEPGRARCEYCSYRFRARAPLEELLAGIPAGTRSSSWDRRVLAQEEEPPEAEHEAEGQGEPGPVGELERHQGVAAFAAHGDCRTIAMARPTSATHTARNPASRATVVRTPMWSKGPSP